MNTYPTPKALADSVAVSVALSVAVAAAPRAAPLGLALRRGRALACRLEAMRARGMSATAIRRALGLSAAEAIAAGVIAPAMVAAAATPRRPRGAGAPAGAGTAMAEVLTAVAGAAGLAPAEILGPALGRRQTRARQLAMYLLRERCAGATLPAIGSYLGRDHTTVLHGWRRARALIAADADFRALHTRALGALERLGEPSGSRP